MGGAFPSPASLGWGELVRAPTTRGSNFGRGWGLPQLFLFPQKNVQGPSPDGGVGGGVGEGLAVLPQSLASLYPHLPAIPHPRRGQSRSVAGRAPSPCYLGSGFPKREALTTHRLGDGISKRSWGLGPGRLGGGEERDRDVGQEEMQERKTKGDRETEDRRQRDRHRKSQRCVRREECAGNPGELRNNKERQRGVMLPKSFWTPCLIFHHQAPKVARSQTPTLLQFATIWVKQGCDQVAKEGKCHQRVEITVGS